ncbi:SH3 and multiple ankyrin repeat domains protein 3, partial [Clonorchis sinensis]
MKKFTLSYNTDSDSTKSAHSSQTVNEVGSEKDPQRTIILKIFLTHLSRMTTIKVTGDAVIWDVKNKLLKAFDKQIPDSLNMGFYLPSGGGKLGKFLEEERLLSEYSGDKEELELEVKFANLLGRNVIILTIKDVQKSFIRYVTRGDHKKVSSILAKGFDPNFHCQKTGETPLTIAVTRNKPQAMITALVAGGAHRDYFSKFGLTPLHKAAAVGNYEAVKTLLDFGQSPNTIDKAGLTPLYYNILNDQDTKICHSLLYEHSQLGICDAEGLQEIHQAARLNRVEQINLLIMYGADVNSRCVPPNGTIACLPPNKFCPMATTNDTPLHVAAAAGQRNAVMRLLSWGADPTLINVSNQTAIQVAQSCDHMELADAIRFFRGDVHHSLYGGPFLPTPTYNPKRRMRKAPQSSYISEPTMLVPIATRPKESGPRTAYSSLPTPVEESNISRPSRINGHSTNMSSTMQRAMSMYNLAENGQKTGAQFPFQQNSTSISPTAVCGSFFMASQIYYDSRVMDSTAGVSATLSRRPKLAARKTDPEMIATFQPTASRPSLQTATRIVPNMPAHKAGIREGDFILK